MHLVHLKKLKYSISTFKLVCANVCIVVMMLRKTLQILHKEMFSKTFYFFEMHLYIIAPTFYGYFNSSNNIHSYQNIFNLKRRG